ncbi:MAG TPA: arylesterase [Vicinamibacterales bacterium]|nr:arylesterase [Vicinamibacterales bacterium]
MNIPVPWVVVALGLATGAGAAASCGPRSEVGDARSRATAPATAAPARAPSGAVASGTAAPAASRPRIVFLGDSLTAGLGLAISDSYPALIQRRLDAAGLNYEVVNAGVSGDTSAGGLARLDWALAGDVRILVVALGGNDALRALPAGQLEQNLATIIERARARGISVVLAGMEAPPNFGRDYIVSFHKVYPELASRYHVAFVPFLLQGVAGNDALNQRDGIHPTAEGARMVADTVWTVLKPLAEGEKRSGS